MVAKVPRKPNELTSQQAISVDEAFALYRNEWILMRVTAVDQYDAASHGYVTFHTKTRKGMQKTLLKTLLAAKQTRTRYYLFFGYRRIKTTEEWGEALAKAGELTDEEMCIAEPR
ncbi:MAG: hypothetical protein ACR2PL_07970 [Dehalococcoidia bacterium]